MTEFHYLSDKNLNDDCLQLNYKRWFGEAKEEDIILVKNAGVYANDDGLKRLQKLNNRCKLIFIVRDPVDRALSSYIMENHHFGWAKDDITEINNVIINKEYNHYMYSLFIDMGLYHKHYCNILKYFDQSQILLLDYKNLFSEPDKYYKYICNWIGVDNTFTPDFGKSYNLAKKYKYGFYINVLVWLRARNNPLKSMAKTVLPYGMFSRASNYLVELNKSKERPESGANQETLDFLRNYYRFHNAKFSQITGMDISHWK